MFQVTEIHIIATQGDLPLVCHESRADRSRDGVLETLAQ